MKVSERDVLLAVHHREDDEDGITVIHRLTGRPRNECRQALIGCIEIGLIEWDMAMSRPRLSERGRYELDFHLGHTNSVR